MLPMRSHFSEVVSSTLKHNFYSIKVFFKYTDTNILSMLFNACLMGKRELVALLGLSSWGLVIVEWLFLAVPWLSLQFVIVVFPDHTPFLFFTVELMLLKQGYQYLKLHRSFANFYNKHAELIVTYNICLKTLLHQVISEPVLSVFMVI